MTVPEPEYEDVLAACSRPASGPGQVSRRLFLQGAMASAGAAALVPTMMSGAFGASPIRADEGILLVIMLGGGNDGLNTFAPVGDARYQTLRGPLAIAPTAALPIAPGFGLHPKLVQLKARYDQGKVAIVRGVGQVNDDHSHFSSMANWMAGTTSVDRTSGWLGRWLDGVPDGADGLRGVTFGSSIPLHLVGRSSIVTAMDTEGNLFGADRSDPPEASMFDAVSGYGASVSGRGRWADAIGGAQRSAVALSGKLAPLYVPEIVGDRLVSQLQLAARLVNANVGVRVINASSGSFDTHDDQPGTHATLMQELDDAIAAFYAGLRPDLADQVTIMTFSEFGRRADANHSNGTDHGAASMLFVVGDQVRGGLYGTQPSLTDLDSRGDLKVKVDFRSVYATMLTRWLGTDATPILGGTFPQLDLFRLGPGGVVSPTPMPPPQWAPFATVTALVQQQYLDFLGRAADAGGTTYWANQLTSGARTTSSVIEAFLDSPEFGRVVRPVARLALACFGVPPAFDDLMAWAASFKATTLASVADAVTAKAAFMARYGALSNAAFAARAHADVLGTTASSTFVSSWTAKLDARTATRGALMAELSESTAYQAIARPKVDVMMTYAGMLRRAPDAGGFDYWVAQVRAGTSVQRLIAQFFASSEYGRRFGP